MNFKNNVSVSVVIPNFNGQKLLATHLPQIIKASKGAEIVVVDDASTDQSVSFVTSTFPQIKVVAMQKNQRFAASCNAGVLASKGDIIVLLNSDVSPETDFLANLIPYFEDPQVFAVGCKEIQNSRVAGRAGGTFKRGLYIHWRTENQEDTETLWVSGGSGAFRKKIWLELHGMDTLFTPAYEEDRDISYRALKRGYKILFCSESIVHHHHETTNRSVLGIRNMKLAAHKNNLLFVWKNITSLDLIFQHIAWLPYHLILTTIRTQGIFFQAFILALFKLPQILKLRIREINESIVSDHEIIKRYEKLH